MWGVRIGGIFVVEGVVKRGVTLLYIRVGEEGGDADEVLLGLNCFC